MSFFHSNFWVKPVEFFGHTGSDAASSDQKEAIVWVERLHTCDVNERLEFSIGVLSSFMEHPRDCFDESVYDSLKLRA